MSASSKKVQDSRIIPQAIEVYFPSGATDPKMEEPQYVYVVIEVLNDLVSVPTLVVHLRGVFVKLEDATNTAWNRIYRATPQNSWASLPKEVHVVGKELYLTAVEADSCILTVYIERRPLQKQVMSGADIDGSTLSARP